MLATNSSLEDRLDSLEQRVQFLETILCPGGFRQHCIDEDMSCPEIVREWFKYHELLHARTLEIEVMGYYPPASIRMAIHRMCRTGEIIRISWGLYRQNKAVHALRTTKLTREITPEQIEAIRQDTEHSHGELAKLLGVSDWAVRHYGHRSPYKFNGGPR